MDFTLLATTAVNLLAPFAKTVGEDLVKTAGDIATNKAKSLFSWLREKFAGDPVAISDISRFEENPDAFAPGLQATIRKKAESDPAFADDLKKRVDDLGLQIVVFQKAENGDQMTAVDLHGVTQAAVKATQILKNVKSGTGVKIVV